MTGRNPRRSRNRKRNSSSGEGDIGTSSTGEKSARSQPVGKLRTANTPNEAQSPIKRSIEGICDLHDRSGAHSLEIGEFFTCRRWRVIVEPKVVQIGCVAVCGRCADAPPGIRRTAIADRAPRFAQANPRQYEGGDHHRRQRNPCDLSRCRPEETGVAFSSNANPGISACGEWGLATIEIGTAIDRRSVTAQTPRRGHSRRAASCSMTKPARASNKETAVPKSCS